MSRANGSTRQRLRNWVFTIHTQCTPASQPGPDGERGGIWDPAAQPFDQDVIRYIICGLEECPESKKLHWQGYIEFNKPVDLSSVKKLLFCSWAHLEPRRGTQGQAIDYSKKDDTGVQCEDGHKILFELGEPGQDGVRNGRNRNENYSKVLGAGTYQEALQLCQELEPANYVLYASSIRRNLMDHFLRREVFIRPAETFNRQLISEDILKRFAIVLTGISGAGKTAWAVAHFKQPYLVSHIDQLKDFNPLTHDGIVFDDMSFNHWPVTSCIHIVDMEYDRFINCRHVMGFIPKGTRRIFTSNSCMFKVFNYGDANEEQCRAIDRRIHHELINEKLF